MMGAICAFFRQTEKCCPGSEPKNDIFELPEESRFVLRIRKMTNHIDHVFIVTKRSFFRACSQRLARKSRDSVSYLLIRLGTL
jgi:hypothetical protein